MKPINFAFLLHISGPDNDLPRQNRPLYLRFNRKLLFRFDLYIEICNYCQAYLWARVANVVLKYRTLLRLVAFTCTVMIVTIVIKCVACLCDTVCRNYITEQMLSDVN